MVDFPLLSFTIFLPLLGALFIFLFIKGDSENADNNAKNTALWTSFVTLFLSLWLWIGIEPTQAGFQFVEKIEWIDGAGIYYHLGIDGLSLVFIVLTALLVPICIIISWNNITKRVREYLIAFLLLESFTIGVFCALDFVLFYIFFEAVLIPMFLIIGVWGGENRIYAAFKFFLYTLVGSVLLLVALLYIYNIAGTTDIVQLYTALPKLQLHIQKWLFLAFLASFAVKVPMWPVHTWLPDAHVQAPTAGSVILAGILLKLGGYGFLRFSLPMLPDASIHFTDFIFFLSVVAVIYTSLVALAQKDMKKLIAYSSVAHMGYVTIGTFAMNPTAIAGGIFQMVSHGVVSAALFLCVGVLYDRMHTKEIEKYGGVVHNMPKFALVFMLFTMASIGLPTTSGFVGEFLVLVGSFQASKLVAALAATAMVLGAVYMLWLYRRVVFGDIKNADVAALTDINKCELIAFAPLVILALLLGIYPALVTDMLEMPIQFILQQLRLH